MEMAVPTRRSTRRSSSRSSWAENPPAKRRNRLIPDEKSSADTRPRWTHTCAWDGHELVDGEYLQVSPHERVCPVHHPVFQTWLDDKSKTMYRVDGEEPDSADGQRPDEG